MKIISDGEYLRICQDGEVVFLPKWLLQIFHSGDVTAYDGYGFAAPLGNIPPGLETKLQAHKLLEMDFYAIVHNDSGLYNGTIRLEYYEYSIRRAKACDCGAGVTDFPSHHSEWCSAFEKA